MALARLRRRDRRLTETLAEEPTQSPDWLEAPEEALGLRRYVETIRERIGLVLLTTLLATAAAVAYVVLAPKTYEAQADLLVTPVSSETLPGLPLLRESSDPTRDVETGALLVANTDVAERVARQLDLDEDPEDLLEEISAEPVAQSNIVAVTATADSPAEAQELANAFTEATVAEQTLTLRKEVEDQIEALSAQLEVSPNAALEDRVAELQALAGGSSPNFRVETAADLPSGQASPRPLLTIIGGFLGGLVLGIVGAFAAQALDPRLRREEQLRRTYNLPILARIPREPSRGAAPLSPRRVGPAAAEAFRTLRSGLDRQEVGRLGRVVMVTGSSPSEGKTTTAINLSSSLALAGHSVILVEADLRRPSLAEALDLAQTRGVVGVLIENASLEESLTPAPSYGHRLRVLPADYSGGWIADLFSIPAAAKMLDELRTMADFVVVDSPPLIEVVDALPLARRCDDLVIIARLGRTRLDRLAHLAELLAVNEIAPAGFAVVGTKPPKKGEDRYYLTQPGGPARDRKGKRGRGQQPAQQAKPKQKARPKPRAGRR